MKLINGDAQASDLISKIYKNSFDLLQLRHIFFKLQFRLQKRDKLLIGFCADLI